MVQFSISFIKPSSLIVLFTKTGSHVIYVLQSTRRYNVISIDNYHNSRPHALDRVSRLSKSELPLNPTERDVQSTEIDSHRCDLTKPDQIRAVFEKYGKGGIWGVIHIAVGWALTIKQQEVELFW